MSNMILLASNELDRHDLFILRYWCVSLVEFVIDSEINDAHSARRTHLLIDFSGENGERLTLIRLNCVELISSKS